MAGIVKTAGKWDMSPGHLRDLILRGLVPHTIKHRGKVAYYDIPANAKRPKLHRGRPPKAPAQTGKRGNGRRTGKAAGEG